MQKERAAYVQTTAEYNPNRLLDMLLEKMQLMNDGALARKLGVASAVIAGMRNGSIPVMASMLIWMREATGLSIHELRKWMGDRRLTCRPAYVVAR
ncbi:MAG TPA: hypothetical protein VM571_02815 [Noviherbaspirillum sp.]|nr:hypothetical protein [Noviherbaspirillum sp.]